MQLCIEHSILGSRNELTYIQTSARLHSQSCSKYVTEQQNCSTGAFGPLGVKGSLSDLSQYACLQSLFEFDYILSVYYASNSIINLRTRVEKPYMGVTSRNFWIYLYISMRLPSWVIHALRSGAGASSTLLALARLARNGNSAFPKCFVDCTAMFDLSALLEDAFYDIFTKSQAKS